MRPTIVPFVTIMCILFPFAEIKAHAVLPAQNPVVVDNVSLQKTISDLKSDDAHVRLQAVQELTRRGPAAKSAIPKLIGLFRDKDPLVRYYAAEAVGKMGAEAVPELLRAFKGSDALVRYYAGASLKRLGPAARAALPDMVQALKSRDNFTRLAALEVLGSIGADVKETIPLLIEMLKDGDTQMRRRAITALGKIGPPAHAAVPYLVRILIDKDRQHYRIALNALTRINPKGNTRKMAGQLTANDPFDRVRKSCRHKVYTFRMVKGKVYKIDLESIVFDSFLRLEDAHGKQLASDDDSGRGRNARLIFIAPRDGVYRIIVTTYARNKTGPYTITFNDLGGGPAGSR